MNSRLCLYFSLSDNGKRKFFFQFRPNIISTDSYIKNIIMNTHRPIELHSKHGKRLKLNWLRETYKSISIQGNLLDKPINIGVYNSGKIFVYEMDVSHKMHTDWRVLLADRKPSHYRLFHRKFSCEINFN